MTNLTALNRCRNKIIQRDSVCRIEFYCCSNCSYHWPVTAGCIDGLGISKVQPNNLIKRDCWAPWSSICFCNSLHTSGRFFHQMFGTWPRRYVPIQPQQLLGPTLMLGDKVRLTVSIRVHLQGVDGIKVRALCKAGQVLSHEPWKTISFWTWLCAWRQCHGATEKGSDTRCWQTFGRVLFSSAQSGGKRYFLFFFLLLSYM